MGKVAFYIPETFGAQDQLHYYQLITNTLVVVDGNVMAAKQKEMLRIDK